MLALMQWAVAGHGTDYSMNEHIHAIVYVLTVGHLHDATPTLP
jgi:hypothetical protein